MPENKGQMDQLFPSGHSHGSPTQLGVSKSTAGWAVPLCPALTPHLLSKNARRKWLLSLNGKYRNLNTLRTFVYKNQTHKQSQRMVQLKNICVVFWSHPALTSQPLQERQ